nr:MAG TPA: hypothetical protein [Bacteriophage sp.]DAI58657.1 MAG TPA: hypothetical protein [Crassvirales sp.]DAM35240.1 MAG TPA: hypothetical protein [Bacteriophage sp.]
MEMAHKGKTNKKPSPKVLKILNLYLFEQEYNELRRFNINSINKIKEACKALTSIINKN